MSGADKHFISAQQLLVDSFKLADLIYRSNFRPHFIVGLWRGGAPIGIAVQEYFEYRHLPTNHIAVRTSSYRGIDDASTAIAVHGLHYLIEHCRNDESLLIVDDVFDSGRSVLAVIEQIRVNAGDNTPHDIRIACPWYKPARRQVPQVPDYFLHQSDKWLVFPHELQGLSRDEIRDGKPELASIQSLFDRA